MHPKAGRSTSEQVLARSGAQDVAAPALGAEIQHTKEELERSRQETPQVARAYKRTKEKLVRGRSTSAVRTAERDQVVTFAEEVSEYAAEATQKVEELSRAASAQATQARHL